MRLARTVGAGVAPSCPPSRPKAASAPSRRSSPGVTRAEAEATAGTMVTRLQAISTTRLRADSRKCMRDATRSHLQFASDTRRLPADGSTHPPLALPGGLHPRRAGRPLVAAGRARCDARQAALRGVHRIAGSHPNQHPFRTVEALDGAGRDPRAKIQRAP